MKKSRLLHYTLLTGLAAAGSLLEDTSMNVVSPLSGEERIEKTRAIIWERVEYVVVERQVTPRRVILETIPELTGPAQRSAVILNIPEPTAAPQKRQDNGQIQALSGQIQQLSISFSSASSASQSISQSAQQVQQSADQASRENSQAISRTQSSALSAVSQASQQANNQIAQVSSSMSSQISRNLASVQSSASSAISVAQVSASSSMSSVINVAMSQLQAAKAEATAVRSDANNFAEQVQRNAISTTNLAIIVAVSVSGAIILTSIIVCIFLRYRRKKRDGRDRRSPTPDEKGHDRPVAVRGSLGARLNPFSSSNSPIERLKLPSFSPDSGRKDEPLNFGFAMSDYSDLKSQSVVEVKGQEAATPFRLQKPPSIKSAEAVRVIRVNSKKDKEQAAGEKATEQGATASAPSVPAQTQTHPELERSQSQVARKPVAAAAAAAAVAAPEMPREEKRKTSISFAPTQPPRENKRDTTISEASGKNRASSRYTMISIATTEPPPTARDSKRFTMVSQPDAEEDVGWRPPSSRGASRANSIKSVNTAQRLAFRDSGDPIPDPDATGWKQPRGGFSMASVSSLMRSDSAMIDARQPTIPKLPKGPKQGASFAAFPTVRNGPPSVVNRPRPALVGKIREDAERRRLEKERQGN
ncbi:hypothetical protein AB5N19_09503 [Seiridium cardinale]|uniref:Uncharacterized protein n=1 Tax=Seiridium cardinale TaxID=138064 RepID=A0ABR2Y8F3_9PEZI